MAVIVMKFGGTSVETIERIKKAAAKVAAEVARGHKVAVVVSAMAGETDRLLRLCRAVAPDYDRSEGDAVVATGEQVTSGLMALALHALGLQARSWQGWQAELQADTAHGKARILDFRGDAVSSSLERGEVAVLAGFQGVTADKRIATLGRGGSDTSAVAAAIALKADRCDIYTDVDGIYTADPRIVANARRIERISYEEMLELAGLGSKVLQVRSVELAAAYNMPVQVLSSFDDPIGSDLPGTLVKQEDELMERTIVTGITCAMDAQITLYNLPNQPGVAAAIFEPLAEDGISIDMISQTAQSETTNMTFTINRDDLDRARIALEKAQTKIGFTHLSWSDAVAKVSIVGIGMRDKPGAAAIMFKQLKQDGTNILSIHTSDITMTVLIAADRAADTVRSLSTAFDLDHNPGIPHANTSDHRSQPRPGP